MDLVQSRPDFPEPPVSSRAGPSALDPESLLLAYIALIRVQPVALQALGLGNPKARQKHEVNGGKRDWVLAVPLGDAPFSESLRTPSAEFEPMMSSRVAMTTGRLRRAGASPPIFLRNARNSGARWRKWARR
jgi:hypothetical protein